MISWKSWRQHEWWKRGLAYSGIFIALGIVCFVAVDQWARVEWRSFERELAISGESISYADYLPPNQPEKTFWNSEVANLDEDTFSLPEALPILDESAEYEYNKTNGKERNRWEATRRKRFAYFFPDSVSEQEAARRLLDSFSEELSEDIRLLVKAANLPIGARIFDPEPTLEKMMETTSSIQVSLSFAKLLALRACCRLILDDSEGALEDIKHLHRLAEQFEGYPLVIDRMIAHTIFSFSFQPVWEGLSQRTWSAAQLRELESSIKQYESSLEPIADTIAREAALHAAIILDSSRDFLNYTTRWRFRESGIAHIIGDLELINLPDPIVDKLRADEVEEFINRCLYIATPGSAFKLGVANHKRRSIVLTSSSLPFWEQMEIHEKERDRRANSIFRSPTEIFLSGDPYHLLRRVADQSVNTAISMIAITCERYLIETGSYSSDLMDLHPKFLRKVPEDPWNPGQSIQFLIGPDGRPVIYSIGANRVDDGGEPRQKREEGDAVWRYSLPTGFTIDDFRR